MGKETNMIARIFLSTAAVGAILLLDVRVHAQGYYPYEPPVVVTPPPMVVRPPPVVVAPPESRCHIVRETRHDDILDTNDWVEREVCD